MGTVFTFRVTVDDARESSIGDSIARAVSRLHEIDGIFSLWKSNSALTRLRAGGLDVKEIPEEIQEVAELCTRARGLTDGWFDPWKMPGGFDPTGLVKGWAIDKSLAIVRESGASAAMVNGGGDIAVYGHDVGGQPWRVGVQHPWRRDHFAGVVEVFDAMATSGSYARGLHLIDPFTNERVNRTASATVVGPSLAYADALATAAAVAGERAIDIVEQCDGYELYLIGLDGVEQVTEGFIFAS